MGQTYQKQFCSMQSPSITSTVSLLQSGGAAAAASIHLHHNAFCLLDQVLLQVCRRMHGSATIVDKVTKAKIPMVTGGFGNGGRLDSTELLINGMWQSGTIQCPKIATPVMKPGGIALFFSLCKRTIWHRNENSTNFLLPIQ